MSAAANALDNGKTEAAVRRGGLGRVEFEALRRIIHGKVGIVLKDNKRALVEARVNRRLRSLKIGDFAEYLDFLRRDETGRELVSLIDAVSTNVTRFYREADHFDFLRQVVSEWAASGRRRLRFWSAACSSGEEPYSMAITLREAAPAGVDMKILATDISTEVLDKARQGVYPRRILQSVPPERRRACFTVGMGAESETCRVTDDLRRMIMFRRMNLNRTPYNIRAEFDVVFLRNTMIYFDQELRSRILLEMRDLIRHGGYLVIGHAETLIGMDSDFIFVQPSIYRRA